MTVEEYEREFFTRQHETGKSKSVGEVYADGYSDGYHECQKEHEWRYVKNGDLPVDTDEVLVCLTSDEIVIDCYHSNTGWENYLNNQVCAWKEITPPKIKELES